jgi:hypothetical protein
LGLLGRLILVMQFILQCLDLLLLRGQGVFQRLNVGSGDRRRFGLMLLLWRRCG